MDALDKRAKDTCRPDLSGTRSVYPQVKCRKQNLSKYRGNMTDKWGQQWPNEQFGVKGRRTGLKLKETKIDANGMPDVDALFESTMEPEDEGGSMQESPMPVAQHNNGERKVKGHQGVSNTRLRFREKDQTSRGVSFLRQSSSSLNMTRQSIGTLAALNVTSEQAAAQSSETSLGSNNVSEPLKTYASSASKTWSQTTAKRSSDRSKGQRKKKIGNEQPVRRSSRIKALSKSSNLKRDMGSHAIIES